MTNMHKTQISVSEPIIAVAKKLIAVLIFSVFFAYITRLIWPGPYAMHYIISLGYGVIGSVTHGIAWRWLGSPNHPLTWLTVLAVVIPLGTLHAWWWIDSHNSSFEPSNFINIALIAVVFCVAVYYFFYSREKNLEATTRLKEAELQQANIERGLIQSELKRLQSQIEPHFLFNTLANIKALVREDPELAETLLDRLTEMLRANLKKSRNDEITLEDELASITAYLDIQKIRLNPRLDYRIEIDSYLNSDATLPPFLIQPLIENAIVHGIEPEPAGGMVILKIARKDQKWQISISDNGSGLGPVKEAQSKSGHGLSLTNIRQRLKALYGDKGSLSIIENQTQGVTTRLEFPCEQ